jgi:hypothetical protein
LVAVALLLRVTKDMSIAVAAGFLKEVDVAAADEMASQAKNTDADVDTAVATSPTSTAPA